jgi:hypothetical protein
MQRDFSLPELTKSKVVALKPNGHDRSDPYDGIEWPQSEHDPPADPIRYDDLEKPEVIALPHWIARDLERGVAAWPLYDHELTYGARVFLMVLLSTKAKYKDLYPSAAKFAAMLETTTNVVTGWISELKGRHYLTRAKMKGKRTKRYVLHESLSTPKKGVSTYPQKGGRYLVRQ